MSLSDRVLQYAVRHGRFSLREIGIYLSDSSECGGPLPDAAIASCLRRLKSKGYLLNKRENWYVRLDKVSINSTFTGGK
jgi:hypothetical protein